GEEGLAPRSGDGQSAIASSNVTWTWSPSSSSTTWSRIERWGSVRRGLRLTATGSWSAGVVLAPLVAVERAVGAVEQAGHRAQAARLVRRETQADRELIGPPRAAVEFAHLSLQSLGADAGALGPCVAHQHGVFIAADPGHQVRVAKRLPQEGSGVAQRATAHGVARGIVHALQVIQVGERDRKSVV